MKTNFLKLKTLLVVLLASASAYASSYVQLIHNCADPAASAVSVYADFGTGQQLIASPVNFRSATSFLTVPDGVAITVYVKAAGASASDPAIHTQVLGPLTANANYTVIASGVVGGGFAANPDSRSTAFTLKVIANTQQTATNGAKVDFAVFHGATDAPGVDVNITGGSTLVPNAKYGDASAYLSVDPTWYPIDIAAAGTSTVVARYVADLSSLTGGAAIVFASGFLNPTNNSNGPAFGLFAALANGTVIQLPAQQNASVQVIHNCAAPAASTVDVYVDGALALDNFAFRTATPFINVLAGVNHTIAVAPANSMSVADSIASFPNINLTAGTNYTVIASGVVDTGFAANPDMRSTAFTLKVIANTRTAATNSAKVDFAVFHGATDAPGVDVNISGGSTLVPNAKYGDASAYLSVDPTWYPIDIAAAGTSTVVASYVADLSSLTGGAAIVFASGFLTPSANNNGLAFGLFAALANGTVIQLPSQQNANVQVLHNCADPAADSVDVYIDGVKALDNFAFRTATPFINVLAGVPHKVIIAAKTSTSIADSIWTSTYTLTADSNYILTASGVVGTSFAANPDGVSTAFQVLVKASARRQATSGTNFDFYAIHGATDAPTVDVQANGALTVVDNAKYADQTDYISVPAGSYTLAVQNGAGTSTIVSYTADLTTLGGKSAVVLASGFLAPSANNNGPAFGLYVALADGGPFIALPAVTSIADFGKEIAWNVYPNPSQGTLAINFDLKDAENVSLQVLDMEGRVVKQLLNGTSLQGKQNLVADLNDLSNGLYVARIITASNTFNSKFSLIK